MLALSHYRLRSLSALCRSSKYRPGGLSSGGHRGRRIAGASASARSVAIPRPPGGELPSFSVPRRVGGLADHSFPARRIIVFQPDSAGVSHTHTHRRVGCEIQTKFGRRCEIQTKFVCIWFCLYLAPTGRQIQTKMRLLRVVTLRHAIFVCIWHHEGRPDTDKIMAAKIFVCISHHALSRCEIQTKMREVAVVSPRFCLYLAPCLSHETLRRSSPSPRRRGSTPSPLSSCVRAALPHTVICACRSRGCSCPAPHRPPLAPCCSQSLTEGHRAA